LFGLLNITDGRDCFKTLISWDFVGVISCDFVDRFYSDRNERSTKSHETTRTRNWL